MTGRFLEGPKMRTTKARWTAAAMVLAMAIGGAAAPVEAQDAPAPAPREAAPHDAGRPEVAPPSPRADAPEPGTIDLVIGDGPTLGDLLKTVSVTTGRSIVWNDQDRAMGRQFKGSTRLRLRADELFGAVRDLIATQDVVLIPVGPPDRPVWFAVDLRSAATQFVLRQYAVPVVLDDDRARDLEHRSGLFVSAVIPAPVDDLREARTALQRLVTGNNVGAVTELPQARAFLVTDFAPQAVAVYRAIQAMKAGRGAQRPDEPRLDVYAFETLELRDAAVTTLHQLFIERTPAPTPAPAAVPAPAAGAGVAAARGPRVAAPGAMLRILVKGTASELALVRVAAEACGGRHDVSASSPR